MSKKSWLFYSFLISSFQIDAQKLFEHQLKISISDTAFTHQNILAQNQKGDEGGTTSIRFEKDKKTTINKYPLDSKTIFKDRTRFPDGELQRDRDLGQTFLIHKNAILGSITLRLGVNESKIEDDSLKIAIQIFEIKGKPKLNDNGTSGFLGKFDRTNAPELDDFLEGETYKSIAVFTGKIATNAKPKAYVKFDFLNDVTLDANKQYAFLLMLLGRKDKASISFYNQYYGSYSPDSKNLLVGHGIRREGFPNFDDDWQKRLKQSPVTFGFPDVCTYRDLWFLVEGK
jgi:hypothetical protein